MNDLVERIPQTELANTDTQILRQELARSLTLTAKHLEYLARIWSELERRGEDLSDLKSDLAEYLPLIASGRLHAAAVIAFAGKKTLLRHLAELPYHEQGNIAAGKPIAVIEIVDGEPVQTQIEAAKLSARQIGRVFAPHGLRSPADQMSTTRERRKRAPRRSTATIRGRPGDGRCSGRAEDRAPQRRTGYGRGDAKGIIGVLRNESKSD